MKNFIASQISGTVIPAKAGTSINLTEWLEEKRHPSPNLRHPGLEPGSICPINKPKQPFVNSLNKYYINQQEEGFRPPPELPTGAT